MKNNVEDVKKHIGNGDFEKAIDIMSAHYENDATITDAITLIKSRYLHLFMDQVKNTISHQEVQIELANLNGAVLDLLRLKEYKSDNPINGFTDTKTHPVNYSQTNNKNIKGEIKVSILWGLFKYRRIIACLLFSVIGGSTWAVWQRFFASSENEELATTINIQLNPTLISDYAVIQVPLPNALGESFEYKPLINGEEIVSIEISFKEGKQRYYLPTITDLKGDLILKSVKLPKTTDCFDMYFRTAKNTYAVSVKYNPKTQILSKCVPHGTTILKPKNGTFNASCIVIIDKDTLNPLYYSFNNKDSSIIIYQAIGSGYHDFRVSDTRQYSQLSCFTNQLIADTIYLDCNQIPTYAPFKQKLITIPRIRFGVFTIDNRTVNWVDNLDSLLVSSIQWSEDSDTALIKLRGISSSKHLVKLKKDDFICFDSIKISVGTHIRLTECDCLLKIYTKQDFSKPTLKINNQRTACFKSKKFWYAVVPQKDSKYRIEMSENNKKSYGSIIANQDTINVRLKDNEIPLPPTLCNITVHMNPINLQGNDLQIWVNDRYFSTIKEPITKFDRPKPKIGAIKISIVPALFDVKTMMDNPKKRIKLYSFNVKGDTVLHCKPSIPLPNL